MKLVSYFYTGSKIIDKIIDKIIGFIIHQQ